MLNPFLIELLGVVGFKVGERAVEESVTHRAALLKLLKCISIYRNCKLRVSFSELLCVKGGQRFVLIRNPKRPEQFGPIGGAIRYLPNAAQSLHEQLGFKDESQNANYDLRGFNEAKYFGRLTQWFNSQKNRERNAIVREIEEELTEIGLAGLVADRPRLEFNLLRRVHEGPTKVRGTDYWQYRLFLIYELQKDDPRSFQLHQDILTSCRSNEDLLLASAEEIRLGRSGKKRIGDHSGYMFGDNRVGTEPPPYKCS